jgi:hypothetical protein
VRGRRCRGGRGRHLDGRDRRGRSGSGRRRRCRRRSGFCARRRRRRRRDAGRQERERIDVSLLLGGASDAEVDVRLARDRVDALTDGADGRALGNRVSAPDGDLAQLEQRDRVAVSRSDRQRPSAARDRADERDGPFARRTNSLTGRRGDVDAAVLAAGVRIGTERERTQHAAVDRPRPGRGRARKDERNHDARQDDSTHRLRPPSLSLLRTTSDGSSGSGRCPQ